MKKLAISAFAAIMATGSVTAYNPYLPLWEHIPDGEPYLFDDPDVPGAKRVYIYGSHDMLKKSYCGTDLVVWSASPDSLNVWRYDGVIFQSDKDRDGKPGMKADGTPDVLFAPDVAVRTLPDGTKEYYLYPNNQEGGRQGMVAKSNRPDGPFEVINWSKEKADSCVGVLRFDPAVFVDDDGRVYGYWGFGTSYGAELDPETMATVKPGTEIVENLLSGYTKPGTDRFFEASSIRKIGDKYVLIYSRQTADGDFGMPSANYTLAYAYSNNPLGPFVYGGTIIDGRGRDIDADGHPFATATPNGNTHGSIVEIDGKWYVFYHRQNGTDEYCRQAMVAPIEVSVEPGPFGKVYISEGEYTSEGFELNGLDPLRKYPAAIASHFTGPTPAYQVYPILHYSGPHFEPIYVEDHNVKNPYDNSLNISPVVNCTDGSTLGYKYYNFDALHGKKDIKLHLSLVPEGLDGEIKIYTTAPWRGNPTPCGTIRLTAAMKQQPTELTATLTGATTEDAATSGVTTSGATASGVSTSGASASGVSTSGATSEDVAALTGKHPLYLTFTSPVHGQSICRLLELWFTAK